MISASILPEISPQFPRSFQYDVANARLSIFSFQSVVDHGLATVGMIASTGCFLSDPMSETAGAEDPRISRLEDPEGGAGRRRGFRWIGEI